MDSFSNDLRGWLKETTNPPKTMRNVRTNTKSPFLANIANDFAGFENFNSRERVLLDGCPGHVWEVAAKAKTIFRAEVVGVEDAKDSPPHC